MGEIAAAHVAGSISLDDAARIICVRSHLLARISGFGTMATVGLTSADAESALVEFAGRVAVAAINGPSSTVLSGDQDTMQELIQTRVYGRTLPDGKRKCRSTHTVRSMDYVMNSFRPLTV